MSTRSLITVFPAPLRGSVAGGTPRRAARETPTLSPTGRGPLIAVALLAVTSAGCPNENYRLKRGELMALSQQQPETRSQRVRVVQGLGDQDTPPEPAPRVRGGASVIIVAPIWVGGTPRRHSHRGPVQHSHGGGGFKGGGSNLAQSKKESAKVVLILAAVAAGALALTEGVRYDGWVAVHPMHPVHLWGPSGEYTWMPLAEVTPEVAAWADKAVIREHEGPWQPLGRAPLDRQGFTYSLLLGSSEIALIGDDPKPGFLGRFQLGYYPLHMLGIQADIAYGWGEDDLGATIFDGRYSLEVDVLPLDAGIFHAGGYGQIGLAYRSDDGIQHDDQDTLFGFGAIGQLELTTRLALTLRAGHVLVHDEGLSELTFGISIY
jgi:hypothetical protein